MKRKHFKFINPKMIKSCKKIKKNKGKCVDIACVDCPFGSGNSTEYEYCTERYANINLDKCQEDKKLYKSAKKFLTKMLDLVD